MQGRLGTEAEVSPSCAWKVPVGRRADPFPPNLLEHHIRQHNTGHSYMTGYAVDVHFGIKIRRVFRQSYEALRNGLSLTLSFPFRAPYPIKSKLEYARMAATEAFASFPFPGTTAAKAIDKA